MLDRVKLAIIGCGGMAQSHLRGLEILKNAKIDVIRLEAVCDLAEDRAKSAAAYANEKLGFKPEVYTNFEPMIEEAALDAVDIVVDHRAHHKITIPCLAAGLHVLVEKPLAITVKAGWTTIEAAKKSGRILAVAENYRRAPENRAVKFGINEGVIGAPYLIFHGWGGVSKAIFCETPWRHMKLEVGGGPMLDSGVHDADLFRYWLGPVKRVFAITKMFEKERSGKAGTIKPTADDTGLVVLEFESGVIGQWAVSWALHGEGFGQTYIYGSEGSLKNYELVRNGGDVKLSKADFVKKYAPAEMFPNGVMDSVALELLDFANAMLHGTKVEVDGMEGLTDEATCYAVYESATLGKPVMVKDVFEGKVESYQRAINEAINLL